VKQDKQDRRSQRTRRLVIAAMMELMAEKSYDAITVQDLLDRANIGRSTFYSHYFDKEDVLASLAEQMLELLSQQFSQRDARPGILPSLALFQHALQNRQYFRAMLRGHAREVVWDAAQASLSRTIEQTLAATFATKHAPSVPLPVMSEYLAGAFLNLLKWWLETEMPYSPAQMDDMFQQLALPGVWAAVEGKRASPQGVVF
jgi:AcrR family transcriptional regulator